MTPRTMTREDIDLLPRKMQILLACFCAEQSFFLLSAPFLEVCEKAVSIAKASVFDETIDQKQVQEQYLGITIAMNDNSDRDLSMSPSYHALRAAHLSFDPLDCHEINDDHLGIAYSTHQATRYLSYVITSIPIEIRERLKVAQWDYYNQLLHFDDIAETHLLGGNR